MKFRHLSVLFALAAVAACSCDRGNDDGPALLSHPDWAPDVKSNLNDFLSEFRGAANAYAVFDFDNTCSVFDIEEQLAIYQLQTMSFRMTPARLGEALSAGLSEIEGVSDWVTDITAAYDTLCRRFGPFSPAGLDPQMQRVVQDDPWWMEFAAKMRAMYDFVGDNASTDVSYNWILYWFTGMDDSEVYDLAYRSHTYNSALQTSAETWTSPSRIESRLGVVSVGWTSGIAVAENISELWRCLRANGIDVWVVSASGVPQVKAAIDAFGLHRYCSGLLAMTLRKDTDGRFIPEYDYTGGCGCIPLDRGWTDGSLPTKAQTAGHGKLVAIENAIAPLYGGATPLAGFMDSTGDFNMCTEFSSLKVVVCFNRADRKITDGGGLVAEIAIYQRDSLGLDLTSAGRLGDTMYLLQGRDENGLRSLRPSNLTLRFGAQQERLFANRDNYAQLAEISSRSLTVGEAFDEYSALFLDEYDGYHNR